MKIKECKSQEQKEEFKQFNDSVSCEHNTGEDVAILPKTTSSCGKSGSVSSSPVQNPKRMGGMGDAQIQRERHILRNKCTCKEGDLLRKALGNEVEVNDVCPVCGGVL